MVFIRNSRFLLKYAREDSPRVKVLHGRTINIHYGATREATLRGDPCKVRHYELSKTDDDARRVWKLLKHAKANAVSETRALALLKPFSYVESDSRQCKQSVLVVHVADGVDLQ